MKPQSRQGNMEVCRIVAMSMIVIYHYFHYVIDVTRGSDLSLIVAQSFFLCGVNLFFLISGYFAIRLSPLKIINLFVIILILQLVNYFALRYAVPDTRIGLANILFFPISKSPYWFIQVYLLLMMCAPAVNAGIASLSLKSLRYTVAILTLATVYSCAIGHNMSNANGYTFLQGLYVYMLGAWLRRDDMITRRFSKLALTITFILFCLVSGAGCKVIGSPFWTAYNGFPILFASAALFMVFIKTDIPNTRAVATLGKSSLYVYLLQDGLFGQYFFYHWQRTRIEGMDSVVQIALFFGLCFIGAWILAVVANKAVGFGLSCVDKCGKRFLPFLGKTIA